MSIIHVHKLSLHAAVTIALVGGACTKPNPRACADGTCTDPAFPFCDVDGAFEDIPNQCIAVDCTPMEFAGCRGEFAITCNAVGTDFDFVECARGCEDGVGCRLCSPNETACTNGTVATCDSAGTVVESQACPLGCFEDEPRCRDIDPSNDLGQFFDMVGEPPTVELVGATIDTRTGNITATDGGTIEVPNFIKPPNGGGVAIRVFIVNQLLVQDVVVRGGADDRDAPGPAVAFVARGEILVRGQNIVRSTAGSATNGCNAGLGRAFQDVPGKFVGAGGGGGGNASDGGQGGAVSGLNTNVPRAVAGAASGSPDLVPLRGGCSGGFALSDASGTFPSGGGAIQLSSGVAVTIEGTIDLRGTAQFSSDQELTIFGGGGAGGSILLEAPEVTLGTSAKLLAQGGDGGGCTPPTSTCAAPGAGATRLAPSTSGGDLTANGASSISSGSGGGGLGRVRINTASGSFTTTNNSEIEADVTTETISSR